MPETALYLYGFVRPQAAVEGIAGVDEEHDVFLVECGDIACAVSVVCASAYQRLPDGLDRASQIDWIAPRAWQHHQIVMQLHSTGTIVPLKFGSICSDVGDVRTILHDFRSAIADLLVRVEKRDEWTLNVYASEAVLSAELERDRPDLAASRQAIERLPDGAAYFARKRLQKTLADLISERLASLDDVVRDHLTNLEMEFAMAPSSFRTADSGLVLVTQGAVLVERDGFASFEARLAELEVQHSPSGLICELSGPWPPYSFGELVRPGGDPAVGGDAIKECCHRARNASADSTRVATVDSISPAGPQRWSCDDDANERTNR